MAPAKKQPKATEGEQIVLDYLRKTNRPYSATDITHNLHGALTKGAIQKLLTQLQERSEIHGKTYGKQVVYVARQDDQEAPSPDELAEMDQRIEELKAQIIEQREDNKQLNTTYQGLNSSLTNEQIQARTATLMEENSGFEERLAVLRSGENVMSEDDKKRIDRAYDDNRKHWKRRKTMFKDIFDAITEHMPGNRKDFMEELGIETDEQVGVDLKADPLQSL
ncbi:hypothetical protein H4R33_002924 [Dimargaris cristalligena]|uniref:Homologous-pairing protein 2 homolog n=1 Tax=Dimargaris cristalligena TaxID=215637 RepID=A0A4P9ZXD7_9FUNG|nr:hypothetical protein H4R33_002924 [Dimargaris cristalligena]RKP38038.1 Tat binding protein 1-interacting protein-domain-containing protein [Dimargaris cristalligena]|eukprot:RKP38038.1 Tat binding protein 1-interacting protein-domain-containing protein [Dimargaris cristalligena]